MQKTPFETVHTAVWQQLPSTPVRSGLVLQALVSVNSTTYVSHLCIRPVAWRTDTPRYSVSTHLLHNGLSSPGESMYVVVVPTISPQLHTFHDMQRRGTATCLATHIQLQKPVPSFCTRFLRGMLLILCDCWVVYHVVYPPSINSTTLHNAFAPVLAKYGGRILAIEPSVLPWRMSCNPRKVVTISSGCTQEASFPGNRLSSTWCPKRRMIRISFTWDWVGKSYDVVRNSVHFCNKTSGRNIFSWSLVWHEVSVLTPGTWSYAIWSFYHGFVYAYSSGAPLEVLRWNPPPPLLGHRLDGGYHVGLRR